MPFFEAEVPLDFSGKERLDKYISTIDGGMNRSRLKSVAVSILVNGKAAKLSSKIAASDKIEIEWEENIPDDIEPENIPLSVIYEDENVCVVNKKQGMVVHPASGNWTGTLVSALLFRWSRESIKTDFGENAQRLRPGIVHRLDKDTSGVIITAKNPQSEDFLHRQFLSRGKIQKEYIAICIGKPSELCGKIEKNIARDSADRKKFKAVEKGAGGKTALTLFACIGIFEKGSETYSVFRLRLKTGRTHQIRVHLKSIGCPILGDPIYGKKPSGTFKSATLMLHSRLMKIRLPNEKSPREFIAPLPIRFVKTMKTLRETFSRKL